MLELDCSILTPHEVLKTSGHVDRFSDLMCKDMSTGEIFRVDHLVEAEFELRLEQHQFAVAGKKAPKGKKEYVRLSDEEKGEYESILAQVCVSLRKEGAWPWLILHRLTATMRNNSAQ